MTPPLRAVVPRVSGSSQGCADRPRCVKNEWEDRGVPGVSGSLWAPFFATPVSHGDVVKGGRGMVTTEVMQTDVRMQRGMDGPEASAFPSASGANDDGSGGPPTSATVVATALW